MQLIIQPATADNWLDENDPSNNNGADTDLAIGEGAGIDRAILKFDFSALPNGAIIKAATLSCYVHQIVGAAGRTLWAYRITQTAWVENDSSWYDYDAPTDWAVHGGDYTATDGASAVGPAAGNWISWNVLAQAQYAQASVSKVTHFLIKDGTETANQISYIWSNNYVADTSLCPKLILTYNIWTGKINGVTNPAKINGVLAGNILSVNGILSSTT